MLQLVIFLLLFSINCFAKTDFINITSPKINADEKTKLNNKINEKIKLNLTQPIYFIVKNSLNTDIDVSIIKSAKLINKEINKSFILIMMDIKNKKMRMLVHPNLKNQFTEELNSALLQELTPLLLRSNYYNALDKLIDLIVLVQEEYKKSDKDTKSILKIDEAKKQEIINLKHSELKKDKNNIFLWLISKYSKELLGSLLILIVLISILFFRKSKK